MLADLPRLRMLRLLESNELSVGELAQSLQLPQSTVSRHLKMLHEGRWIAKRAEGTASLYRLVESTLGEEARQLWHLARGQLGSPPTLDEDDRRLCEVLARRRVDGTTFFGRIGGEWDQLRGDLFGDRFTSDALLGLASGKVIADLGCGTGNAAVGLAPYAARLIAVDREPSMLEAARKRLEGADNVEFRQGDLESLPIDDGEVDVAIVLLVLHHLPEPERAVTEIARVLRPGGVVLIVDMVAHDRSEYRHTMGHQHLGFDRQTVAAWAAAAGLEEPRYVRLRPDPGAKGPGLFVAIMRFMRSA
jgi:SAM-dependent methyltransferase